MTGTIHALAVAGTSAAAIAIAAWAGDRRRMRRKDLDRVGFMPWTGIFFLALLLAVVLLGIAARGAFSGS